MSVAEVLSNRAFEPTTDPAALARAHEDLRRLSSADLEHDLFKALQDEAPCKAEVRGPTGSGKSSLIMKVVGDVARLDGPPSYEVLLLRAGDAEGILDSSANFAHHLLDVIRAQGYRFADAVQEELEQAGAREVTATEAIRTDTLAVEGDAKVVKGRYQGALQRAYEQRKYGDDPARSREELEGVLRIIRDQQVRPVVVIDDTDKFADNVSDDVDAQAVDGLFDNGVRLLDDLRLDYVIAAHPHFEGIGGYETAASKFLRPRLDMPWLDLERRPVSAILGKHLYAAGISMEADELVTNTAQVALWGVYQGERSVRDMLDVAQRATKRAFDRGSDAVEGEDVNAVLKARSAS